MQSITASEFVTYRVMDNPAPCAACSPTRPSPAAPVLIKGKQYCLWCALGIAEALLSPNRQGRFEKALAKARKSGR